MEGKDDNSTEYLPSQLDALDVDDLFELGRYLLHDLCLFPAIF